MEQGSALHRWSSSHGRLLYWLRWLAVLPAALMAIVLVSFPVHIAVLLINSGNTEDSNNLLTAIPPETLERFGQAFFAPVAMVFAAAKTAPSHRLYVAGLLVIAYAMFLGAAMMYAGSHGYYSGRYWAEFAVVVGLGFAGLAYSMYQIHQEEG